MERAASRCGRDSPPATEMTLNIHTTTGGSFSVSLGGHHTVAHLKRVVSKKLRVPMGRICLLHRERQLCNGTLEENGLLDGSRVVLLPSVETGLLSQRHENSVMQALETLNDTQINDFLSGKAPLNLTVRLGGHMMLIQLQLSTLNSSRSSKTQSSKASTSSKGAAATFKKPPQKRVRCNSESSLHVDKDKRDTIKKNFQCSLSEDEDRDLGTTSLLDDVEPSGITYASLRRTFEPSPIKSLSKLVSSPLDASIAENKKSIVTNAVKNSLIDMLSSNLTTGKAEAPSHAGALNVDTTEPPSFVINPESSSDDSDVFTDQSSFLTENTIDEYPMENLFNSAVDKGFFENGDETMMDREISNLATTSLGSDEATTSGSLPSFQNISEPMKTKKLQYLLHKSSKFKHPICQNKQKAFMQSVVKKHKKRMQSMQEGNDAQPSTSRTEPYSPRKLLLQPSCSTKLDHSQPSTSKQSASPLSPASPASPAPPVPDTQALIEASRNLTQTLRKLSKEVLTNKIDLKNAAQAIRSKLGCGAVIESMKHHGKGIYSGTFSGTLNPALQDRHGRPKRDISTIIHILNDLLCAKPPTTRSQGDKKRTAEESARAAPGAGATEVPTACRECSVQAAACSSCESARTLALENSKTKCKLEQLRLVMQQKKQRREARRLQTGPYTPQKPLAADLQEEIDTLA